MESGMNTTCSASLPSGVTAAISPGASGGQGDASVSIVTAQSQATPAFLPQGNDQPETKREVAKRSVLALEFHNEVLSAEVGRQNQKIEGMSERIEFMERMIQMQCIDLKNERRQVQEKDHTIKGLNLGYYTVVKSLKDKDDQINTLQSDIKQLKEEQKKQIEQLKRKQEEEGKIKEQQLKRKHEADMEELKHNHIKEEQEYERTRSIKEHLKNENQSLIQTIKVLNIGAPVATKTIELRNAVCTHENNYPSIPYHDQSFKVLGKSLPISIWPADRPNMGVELQKENQRLLYKQVALQTEISSLASQLADLKSSSGHGRKYLPSAQQPSDRDQLARKRKAPAGHSSSEMLIPPPKSLAVTTVTIDKSDASLPAVVESETAPSNNTSPSVIQVTIEPPSDTPLTVTRVGRVSKKPKMYEE
ncbi:hypothetical protein M3P05_09880 [Sansalvadorimonas sp. 2012CJ34-2]|uniref:Uncharacterized protein n=1 Tax=Parendozoicomonas callyspongiae TaxID=2942213 RepID=A0ABT0PFT6_9GAMM|nr:hypothetical protein [Sansalvadorimonas sp. 2012CJ34-2]MCL6270234.1 hypothetical protein [Sansalvadorimonas sp. 2012CJ34-2]